MTRIERFLAATVIAAAIITVGRMAQGQQSTHTPDPQDCLHGNHTGDPHCPTVTPTLQEVTATETPLPSLTPTPTATPTVCLFHCDCDGNGTVTIGEIIQVVNMFLGNLDAGCDTMNVNGDAVVSIGEVVQCVNNYLGVCP